MNKPQSPRRPRGRGPKRSNKGSGVGRGDNRGKGNPRQSLEKYKTMARDALQSGDRVLAEHYFQFADHYQRVCNERFGVSIEDDSDSDVESVDQEDQQSQPQARRPQQRSRSQRAEEAVAMERTERPRQVIRKEPEDAPVAKVEDKAPDVQLEDAPKKAEVVRPNGRRRAVVRKETSPEGEAPVTAEASPPAPEDEAPKLRPRRRRKLAEETADAAPE